MAVGKMMVLMDTNIKAEKEVFIFKLGSKHVATRSTKRYGDSRRIYRNKLSPVAKGRRQASNIYH